MVATVVTTTGAGFIIDKLDNTVGAATYFIGWGTGGSGTGGTATYADAALKATATETQGTGSGYATTAVSQPSADTLRFVSTITAGVAKTIEEVGVLTSSATSGVLVIRGSHAAVTLATGDSIQYTVNLQVVPT